MSYVHPDKWFADDWRKHFERVVDMRKRNWHVWAKCARCGANQDLDLVEIERKLGPDYSLWGRRPRCRMVTTMCEGRCKLMAWPPHRRSPFELVGPRRSVVKLPKAANDE